MGLREQASAGDGVDRSAEAALLEGKDHVDCGEAGAEEDDWPPG